MQPSSLYQSNLDFNGDVSVETLHEVTKDRFIERDDIKNPQLKPKSPLRTLSTKRAAICIVVLVILIFGLISLVIILMRSVTKNFKAGSEYPALNGAWIVGEFRPEETTEPTNFNEIRGSNPIDSSENFRWVQDISSFQSESSSPHRFGTLDLYFGKATYTEDAGYKFVSSPESVKYFSKYTDVENIAALFGHIDLNPLHVSGKWTDMTQNDIDKLAQDIAIQSCSFIPKLMGISIEIGNEYVDFDEVNSHNFIPDSSLAASFIETLADKTTKECDSLYTMVFSSFQYVIDNPTIVDSLDPKSIINFSAFNLKPRKTGFLFNSLKATSPSEYEDLLRRFIRKIKNIGPFGFSVSVPASATLQEFTRVLLPSNVSTEGYPQYSTDEKSYLGVAMNVLKKETSTINFFKGTWIWSFPSEVVELSNDSVEFFPVSAFDYEGSRVFLMKNL